MASGQRCQCGLLKRPHLDYECALTHHCPDLYPDGWNPKPKPAAAPEPPRLSADKIEENRVRCNAFAPERWIESPDEQRWNKLLDDILRQVVCDCGNYRHHGVDWMPEGSGEGKGVARRIIADAIRAQLEAAAQQIKAMAENWENTVCSDEEANRVPFARALSLRRAANSVLRQAEGLK